jgi:chromosome partitioning protein
MRSLLITGQKGGVGKTTTAMNLATVAADSGRVLLVDLDPAGPIAASLAQTPDSGEVQQLGDWTGRFWPEAIPGVDLFWPQAANDPSDATAMRLATLTRGSDLGQRYHLAVIDAPSLRGTNTALLGGCDEALLVTRPEPVALRTLPALLGALQDERVERPEFQFHGMLLTLPPGMKANSPEVEQLRRSLGGHVLPMAIEHDAALRSAPLHGTVGVPRSDSESAYGLLAESLQLLAPAPVLQPLDTPRGGGGLLWLVMGVLGMGLGIAAGVAVGWYLN